MHTFPAIHRDTPFGLLTLSQSANAPKFAAELLNTSNMADPRVVGRIAKLVDLFARADTLLVEILLATLTREALGLATNETVTDDE